MNEITTLALIHAAGKLVELIAQSASGKPVTIEQVRQSLAKAKDADASLASTLSEIIDNG
jgi:hypothetical protein